MTGTIAPVPQTPPRTHRLVSMLGLACVLGAASGGLAAKPEEPAGDFSESVEVRLVQVDAWATDSGKPVLDLRQDELRLTEDGKPVEIMYFSAPLVSGAAPIPSDLPAAEGEMAGASARVEAPPPLEPATVAILLDEAHLGIGSRARTLAALREWIAGGGIPRHADAMLVTHARELTVLVPKTRDRQRLLDAIDRIGGPSTLATERMTTERRALDQIRDHQRNSIEQQRDSPSAGGRNEQAGEGAAAAATAAGEDVTIYFEPPCSGRLLDYAEQLADTVERQAEASLEALNAFSSSLAALRGRRILIFVSEGMPSRPGGAAFDYVRTLCDGSGVRHAIQYAIDVQAQAGPGALRGQLSPSALALAGENRRIHGDVEQVVARANSSGVSIWSFGARGLTESGSDAGQETRTQTPDSMIRQKGESEDVLNALAVDTGGRAILESNDFGKALGELADDLFHSYSIAFASPRAGDGRLHAIRLETTRPGVRLRYRKSWRDSSKEEELAGLVGGALSFGIDRPGLGVVATLGRQQAPDGERLVLRLTLPRASVTTYSGKGGSDGLLRLAIALQPAGGEATPVRTRSIKVLPPAPGAKADEPIVQDIALPEIGRGALVAVGLRDELSGEIGVFRIEVGGS